MAPSAHTTLPPRITITEVGPRDGLQNEREVIDAGTKVGFIDRLSAAGIAEIETSSFVSAKWVPQLADAGEVFAGIVRRAGTTYSALVPNEKGLDAALAADVDKVAVFTAASETFSQKNTNATIAQTVDRFAPVIERARDARLPVRAYVSCVVACPYEGPIGPGQVRDVAARLLDLGVTEIDLGETIGVAAPSDIERLYNGLGGLLEPAETVLHMHDTRGTALACVYRAMQMGVHRFDTSCGGLGGCPYAPGAAGNLATEDLVYFAARLDVETGIDLARLVEAGRFMRDTLGRDLPGRAFNALCAAAH